MGVPHSPLRRPGCYREGFAPAPDSVSGWLPLAGAGSRRCRERHPTSGGSRHGLHPRRRRPTRTRSCRLWLQFSEAGQRHARLMQFTCAPGHHGPGPEDIARFRNRNADLQVSIRRLEISFRTPQSPFRIRAAASSRRPAASEGAARSASAIPPAEPPGCEYASASAWFQRAGWHCRRVWATCS